MQLSFIQLKKTLSPKGDSLRAFISCSTVMYSIFGDAVSVLGSLYCEVQHNQCTLYLIMTIKKKVKRKAFYYIINKEIQIKSLFFL